MTVASRFRLDGKRAFVTASSRGIGRGIALALAEAGASVVVHGATRLSEVQAVAGEIVASGGRAHALLADFAEPRAVSMVADRAEAAFGGLDILVSNAAVQVRQPWDRMTADAIDFQMQVNFRATLTLITRLASGMMERGWGRILTVGSVQEHKPHPEMVVYAATKSAQTNMVENLARQLAPRGVTVNNLAPGVILTERNTQSLSDQAYAETVKTNIPAGFFGEAFDCAGAALLLCSDAGRYITGTSLIVDGGMHL
ncbi:MULTISPECIES: SDR family oxidoreductase [unclassified Chelatococcus]|uniref:SDR family NAD(P)-dependent oxidoreductase n=1 Tax=unclassified Chelatococcus TaxID=2638111 RepID=UPI001BCB4298|nr:MULTISPECIES: SDR family oxidoreductase [unclassified Chelatococcus]MBS7700489.1 SDR family oxidoreductase [Chelatococcus sp. YT9]MBX3556285.1 SDR family oxidoreductase [Chelatococcus sp.]